MTTFNTTIGIENLSKYSFTVSDEVIICRSVAKNNIIVSKQSSKGQSFLVTDDKAKRSFIYEDTIRAAFEEQKARHEAEEAELLASQQPKVRKNAAQPKEQKVHINRFGQIVDYKPKLNFEEAQKIRAAVAAGGRGTKTRLAEAYGVDFETIAMIVKGITYKEQSIAEELAEQVFNQDLKNYIKEEEKHMAQDGLL